MTHAQTITNRVIETVARHPDCLLEELVLDCPELTWNQVFLAVDQLTRTGELLLARKGPGVYVVRVAPHHQRVSKGGESDKNPAERAS